MQPEQRTAARPRDRRAQIFAHSLDLFWRHGFDGVTIAEIATDTGISAAAVYRHVPDKHALLAEPIREMVIAWYASALIAVDGAHSADDALDRLASAVSLVAVDRPEVVGLWHREARHLTDELRNELVGLRARTIGLWADNLVEARTGLSWATAEFRIRAALGLLNSIPLLPRSISRVRLLGLLEQLIGAVVLAPPNQPLLADASAGIRAGATVDATAGGERRSRREELLVTGAKLFREQGYHRVGIDEIAEAVGIRGPSVYSWFQSKADLLFELLDRIADHLDVVIDEAIQSAPDPRGTVEALVRGYAAVSLANRDLVAVYATELQHLPDNRRRTLQRRRQSRTKVWVRTLREARPELTETPARVVVLASLEMLFAIARSHRYEDMASLDVLIQSLGTAALLDS